MEGMAKPGLRRVGKWLVENNFTWNALGAKITRFGLYLASQRAAEDRDRIVRNHHALSKALAASQVLAGPFAGLKYSGVSSFCSAKYPKLLGTYECELHPILEALLSRTYDCFVNVGAADGYYTVGLALRFPQMRVIAYEADPRGMDSLKKLCRLNGVEDRVEIRGRSEASDLVNLSCERALVVMDCEGYEDFLLTPESVRCLSKSALIIETHDGFVPGITLRLKDALSRTHHVDTIDVFNDLDRADKIEIPEMLWDLTRSEVNALLAETRTHACLRWLAARPRIE